MPADIGHRERTEPTSRHIPLGTGLTYHVLEWDEPASQRDHTVVLIHGFLDNAWGFERVVSAGLAGAFHVVAPDMRGHGDSDRVGAGGYYHFFDYVADLHEIIRTLGRERVSLVGHSMGGTIAGYYAGSFPAAIQRLALLEGLGPPEPDTPMPERVRRWISGWRRGLSRAPSSYATLDDAAEALRSRDPRIGRDYALELASRSTTRLDSGRYRFKHDPLHTTTGPYPFRVDLAVQLWEAMACPTLLVDGEESELGIPDADLRRRTESFKDARRVALPGAGHMMQRHRPEALAAVLLDFLSAG